MTSSIRDGCPLRASLSYESNAASLTVEAERPEKIPDLPRITVELDETYFAPEHDDSRTREHVSDYCDLVGHLYDAAVEVGYRPKYVLGADPNQLAALYGQKGEVATTRDGVLDDAVEQRYWLQIIPPGVIETIGKTTLLSTPAWRVEELEDGAVLLAAYVNPHFPENVDAIADHVGIELPTYWI